MKKAVTTVKGIFDRPKVQRKISDLKGYDMNSRTHSEKQVQELAGMIKEFGFTNPILIDENNMVIAGHGRLEACGLLKIDDVPCIVIDGLSEVQKDALVILDNKSSENAGWNEDILKIKLMDLEDADFDMEGFGAGFEDFSFDFDLSSGEEIQEDEIPELDEENVPITQKGDIWLLGKNKLMCGDSTAKHEVEMLMAGNKADLVFTDPPYGVDYEGIENDDLAGLPDLLDKAFKNYKENMKQGASIYMFHADRTAHIFRGLFDKYFHFSSMIIWNKNSLTLSQTDYQSKHEPCLYGWEKTGTHKWYSDRKQVSVWDFDKEHFKGHTTPKPLKLIANALDNSSKKGDIVLDLFGGSGSTLIACEKNNRVGYTMEISERYCDLIVKRYSQLDIKGDIKLVRNGKEYSSNDMAKILNEFID